MTDTRARITIHAPDESTIHAARHLDATEGRVRVGSTVDASTRSAITRVLDYVATAHNSPAAPLPSIHANDVQGFCPACTHPTLYVGDGGHLVCSLMDCPKPEAADELLHGAPPACAEPGPWGDAHTCQLPAGHRNDHKAHDGCGWVDEQAAAKELEPPVPDDSDPADLTGYLAPEPAIRCLTATAADPRTTPNNPTELREQLDRAETELRWYAEAESADIAAGSYASAQATLTITVTGPNAVHAVRWAGHIRDLVHVEFDSSMNLHSFIELEPGGPGVEQPARTTPNNPAAEEPRRACKPGATVYFCPASGETESDCHGGFNQCCDRPDLHRPAPPELRDPCPRCESSSDRIPRRLMADHNRDAHPEEQQP